jgi:hypothetical protein
LSLADGADIENGKPAERHRPEPARPQLVD